MRQIVVSGSGVTDFCENVRAYERLGWKVVTDATWREDGPYHVFMRISEYGFAKIRLMALFLPIKARITKQWVNPLYWWCSIDKSIIKI